LQTCAIGPATAEKMRSFKIPVTKISKEYVAESILNEMTHVRGKRILIPRAEKAREILPKELKKRGAQVDVITAYRTVLDQSNFSTFQHWLEKNQIHCITFTSSSTVRNFFQLLNKDQRKKIVKSKKIQAASIGPVTTQTLKEYGWFPSIIASKPTVQHLTQAITQFYKSLC
jgi:uroporphyrinogen III methyltransferase/synthase